MLAVQSPLQGVGLGDRRAVDGDDQVATDPQGIVAHDHTFVGPVQAGLIRCRTGFHSLQ